MLARKRPRRHMRRTSSMREFASETEAPRPSNPATAVDSHRLHALLLFQQPPDQRRTTQGDEATGQCKVRDQQAGADLPEAGLYAESVVPPEDGGAVRRRNSGDSAVLEAASFLMACGLCKRRLGPGRDTFMYRGETAFCSLECRQQHINQVELKEKCSLSSMKDAHNSSDKSDDGESVAAS